MTQQTKSSPKNRGEGLSDRDEVFIPSKDGMSEATARVAIDRDLRRKIMQDFDLVELENKGRYFAAKAYSKDGRWLNELLIDKQTGNITVVDRLAIHGGGKS